MDDGWAPYVPVAQRRKNAERAGKKLRRQGREVTPVRAAPRARQIATTPWGQAWCENAEHFAAWGNRLDRGKRYIRNGSVFHLEIQPRKVEAYVSGSEIYRVELQIAELKPATWKRLVAAAHGQVASLFDLLQARLDADVMATLTQPKKGLFPTPGEVRLDCSCPDWAEVCKHVAAVFYGVGVLFDDRPELLFTLRDVDQNDLVGTAPALTSLAEVKSDQSLAEAGDDLGALFGIELAPAEVAAPEPSPPTVTSRRPRPRTPKTQASGLPPRLPKEISAAQLLAWGVPRSTFQNWIGAALARGPRRGVYLRTRETRARILAARARLGLDAE